MKYRAGQLRRGRWPRVCYAIQPRGLSRVKGELTQSVRSVTRYTVMAGNISLGRIQKEGRKI